MHLKLLRVSQYPEILKLSQPQTTSCRTNGTSLQSTEGVWESLCFHKTGALDFGRRWRNVVLDCRFTSTCILGTRWEARRTLHRNAKSRTWPGTAGSKAPVTLLQLLYRFLPSFLHSLLFHLPGTLFLTLPHLVQCLLPERCSLFSHSTAVSSLAAQYPPPRKNSAISLHGINPRFYSHPDAYFTPPPLHCEHRPGRRGRCQWVWVDSVKSPTASQRTVCHITGL